jgi:hypothetical protein
MASKYFDSNIPVAAFVCTSNAYLDKCPHTCQSGFWVDVKLLLAYLYQRRKQYRERE